MIKHNHLLYLICFLLGFLACFFLEHYSILNFIFDVNFAQIFSLLVTLFLAFYIPSVISKKINNKNILRDLIIKDLELLEANYQRNIEVLKLLKDKEISISEAQNKISFIFHEGDLYIDRIQQQLKMSFFPFSKKEKKSLRSMTNEYFTWLTGGDLFTDSFNIDSKFIQIHQTLLSKNNCAIRLFLHRLCSQA